MFVVLLTYKKPLDVVEEYLAAHREFLDEGYSNDFFVVSGPQNPRIGGIIISQLTDHDQLTKILKDDPFNMHHVADYEIIEFNPVKRHPNFASFVELTNT